MSDDKYEIGTDARHELFNVYKTTIDFLKFEATTLWQIFNAFLIANTIILGFISTSLTKNEKIDLNYSLFLIVGIIGLIISLCWVGTFYRNSGWYKIRMDQAKKLERNLTKDNNKWCLLTGEVESYSTGIKNMFAGYMMIITFLLIYLIIVIWSILKMNYSC